jgi:hypothetical protein
MGIFVGPTNALGILVWRSGNDLNGWTWGNSAMIPIKRGTYYRVNSPGGNWLAQGGYDVVNIIFYKN